jgi:uncharacterized Fe-S center protein
MSKVYFIRAESSEPEETIERKVTTLFNQAGLGRAFKKNDLAALKMHVGEPGTRTFIKPAVVRALVTCMKASGTRPFLTDSAVLYKSPRDDGLGHTEVASAHGFGLSEVGAPFIPADGILGKDATLVPVYEKHYEEVAIASAIIQARSMLVLTHVTGHLGTGFGGVLKNLGMGCSSKKAKLSQHNGQQPKISASACIACGACADNCPSDAITVDDSAVIDNDKCIGCGECIAICQEDAVEFDWSVMGRELEERIVEHAAGVFRQKSGAVCFFSAATDITKDCDCLGLDQPALLPDLGYLASFDPVALDRAAYDLITESAGKTLESMSYPGREGAYQMQYAEAVGLGSGRYDLIEISHP